MKSSRGREIASDFFAFVFVIMSITVTTSFIYGGRGEIRTRETLAGLVVFKTTGFNRSPTLPNHAAYKRK